MRRTMESVAAERLTNQLSGNRKYETMKFYIFIFNEYQINVYRISSPYGAKIILVT
jgi:hypothetical protein